MTERSLFWDTAALGDGPPYTQTDLQDRFYRSLINGTGNRGPVQGWRDELEVSGTSSPLTVATGGACVYGMLFDSDSALTIPVSTPSSGLSRYDRIVVQRTWTTQVTRITRISGTAAAAPAVPALTQTANIVWEIPIATILVDDEGLITVTDTREYCTFSTEWPANAVTAGMFAEGAVTAAKIPDRTRYELKGSKQIRPDGGAACTWVAGASYDYWQFADAAFNRGWVYFMGPTGLVGNQVDFYTWSVPNVNGAGAGAENCQWDYSIYAGASGGTLANTAGTTNVDQQLRVNTTVYRDQIVAGLVVGEGQIISFRLSRDGAADSYNSAMRLLGIEMVWTADA